MTYVVEHANLDEQPVTVVDKYLTVCAVGAWVVQQDGGDAVTVKLGRCTKIMAAQWTARQMAYQ